MNENSRSDNSRLMSRAEMHRVVQRVMSFVKDSASTKTDVTIEGWWNTELQWARNLVSLSCDRRDVTITIGRTSAGRQGYVSTNQLDDISLEAAVRGAERVAKIQPKHEIQQIQLEAPVLPTPTVKIWSDATANVTNEQRANVAKQLTTMSEDKGFSSAGYLEMRIGEIAKFTNASASAVTSATSSAVPRLEDVNYQTFTQAQCSATVRHPKGVGSGWAGLSSYDWLSIDGTALVQRAVEKCQASLNPVGIEPGRYTTILEPQAVSAMCDFVATSFQHRVLQEGPRKVWTLEYDGALNIWRAKLGLKVVDERISFTHNPQHPELGVIPEAGLAPIEWIKNGVLNTLSYDRNYALTYLVENEGQLFRPSYTVSGGDTSMEEMIATTRRGLIVTRFWGLNLLDESSLLCTGVTRDGLWLVENGKISKAVKNFRFTESPIFMLNQVVQIGPATRVFRPVKDPYQVALTPAIVPALKVNDFSFTSTIDAV